jgi:hypothetical protein
MTPATDSLLRRTLLYANALVLGFTLMGFEMLGSRYLNPYFGSGIETWAALISTVLVALMFGYFMGGELADRFPRTAMLGALVLGSGVWLGFLPFAADPSIEAVIAGFGDGVGGVLVATIVLLLVPLTLLGTFSPFGVRLLLDAPERSGRVTGWVYGVSTIGNVLGTLGTTFLLIPNIGTRTATLVFAGAILASGLVLVLMDRRQ